MYIILLLCILWSNICMAAGVGLDDVSNNITGSLDILTQFVVFACLLVGIFCFFAAIVKYFAHRRNPLAAPFSAVMWLLLMSLMLLGVPLAHVLSGHDLWVLELLK